MTMIGNKWALSPTRIEQEMKRDKRKQPRNKFKKRFK